MYATNHRGSVINDVIVAGAFLALKYKLYGFPQNDKALLLDGLLLVFSAAMLMRQRGIYQRITTGKLRDAECGGYIFDIVFNKLLYMLPWLYLMFAPLVSATVYEHLLGYIFVFAATATYASASAPLMLLLIFDIGLPAAFAAGVTLANLKVQETIYFGTASLLFSLYVFSIGHKIRLTTLQMFESKNEMAKSAKRADDANRAKSSFLALMSHEIRTPMTGIFGMLDFLKESPLNDEQKDFVATIQDCSKTLLNTLNDILDFSKVESGKLTISEINFDYHAMLKNAQRLMQQTAGDKGLQLNLEIATAVPARVFGDPHRIQQVVVNLINNAIKFTETGSVTVRATFAETKVPMLRLEIIDTGIGISKENQQKLFSAFSQADNSISRKYGGTGLGLSIARKLSELMGGKIGVTSEEGKGSTFWVELPFQLPRAGADEQSAEDAGADIPPQRILLVEDNPVNMRIITRMLAHRGHTVASAANGDEAIKLVQEQPFDMVFMDVNMPGKNGFEATRAIHALQDGRYRRLPIVALTANIMEDYVRRCYDCGMVGHVGKPFTPQTLFAALAATVAGKATRVEQPRPKSTRETLTAVRDGMGTEFMRNMVMNNLIEGQRLLEVLLEAHAAGNLEAMATAAHDMKSVTGLIGMNDTSAIAGLIEGDCIGNRKDRLADLIEKLKKAKHIDTTEAERLAKTMPTA